MKHHSYEWCLQELQAVINLGAVIGAVIGIINIILL